MAGKNVFDVVEDAAIRNRATCSDVDEADRRHLRDSPAVASRQAHPTSSIDVAWTNVNWIREGRIYRSKSFTNHAEALEAAGLSE